MTAVVPLLAEALNLAITEHWREVWQLRGRYTSSEWSRSTGQVDLAAWHDEQFSAGIEALAVALHARLQEMEALG